MNKTALLICICLLACPGLYTQNKQKDNNNEIKVKLGPNHKIFQVIQQLWIKKNHRELREKLHKRVRINLGKFRGRYPREMVVGILRSYFAKIKIAKFKYVPKKMSRTRGVAAYQSANDY